MEIRDPVHGSIPIDDAVIPILRHDFFQRLRNIKQLGFSEYVFPGATHTRYLHSLGVMHVGSMAFERLFPNKTDSHFKRVKQTFMLACLLHDVGHAPLSHATESVMPTLKELNIPKEFLKKGENVKRQATHEDYTIKAIVDSSFSSSFKRVNEVYGVEFPAIVDLIRGECNNDQYFTIEGINYFPLLSQLVSSEMDCDRMDYLLRDSYFCGVSYGSYDLDWLLDNLSPVVENNQKAYLGITERAVVTFDDFLLSRYHMFIMVYFHYRSVALEKLLMRYFQTASNEYTIPADIEQYIDHDDHLLMKYLRKSTNPYAQAIVKNKIPKKIFESFNEEQLKTLTKIQDYLDQNKIEYIRCSSQSRLSKYYSPDQLPQSIPLKVVRKCFRQDKEMTFPIEQATDLFQKYSLAHGVTRLHCEFNKLSKEHQMAITNLLEL